MRESLKQTCGTCKGVGRVPRERRKMVNGVPDPADFRREDICARCGGGGLVAIDRAMIVEKKPG